MKTFLGFYLKLKKKVTAFHCFQTAPPPKKLFLAPSSQAHYFGSGPASNSVMRPEQAEVSTPVPNCIFAFF